MTNPRPPTPDPFLVTTPADLHRLAAEMRGHVAEHDSVAARVVCLSAKSYQVILRPGPDHQIQLLVSAAGYRFPDEWLPELRAAFGVPDGTLMVYDLVKRVHQVVKWTWTVDAPAEQLQMSFAELETEPTNQYQGGL